MKRADKTSRNKRSAQARRAALGCQRTELSRIGYTSLFTVGGKSALCFVSGVTIDADGSPHAYHPLDANGHDTLGLDYLANAGHPAHNGHPAKWWALVTDSGLASGRPVVQGKSDPAPGFYISTTALVDPAKTRTDPARYVNAETVPFIVLAGGMGGGARTGDFAVAVKLDTRVAIGAVCGDIGPAGQLGEGSIALANGLGIPANPKHGGVADGVLYIVFPRSRAGWPLTLDAIQSAATRLFQTWGGMEQVAACSQS